MKSPYMMKGYYKDDELTQKVLKNGWLHSGDKGSFDENGFLKIIGRVSDAFKTSKGKFITPNPLEENIEKNVLVEQVCIAGLGIPQPIAIINLSEVAQSSATKEEIESSLEETLTTLNKDLANYTKVSTIIIDQNTWNTENALLTPTLKIRRGAHFAKAGYHILWVSLLEDEIQASKKQLQVEVSDCKIDTLVQDLTQIDAPKKTYDWVFSNQWKVDVLINNAGFGTYGFTNDIDMDRELNMINLNMVCVYKMTRLFLNDMVRENRGTIINISSNSSFQPTPKLNTYGATYQKY